MSPVRSSRTLLLLGLACCNAIVFGLSAYSLHQSREQFKLRAETATQNIATAIDQTLSGSIDRIDLGLRTVADELERQLADRGIDDAAMSAYLARMEQRLPEAEAFRVANADGEVFLGRGVSRSSPASWADRGYFQFHREHADAGMQMTEPQLGRVSRQYIVGLSRRFNFPDGRFAGVISAPITVDHFSRIISSFDVGPHGTIVLRDREGGLITRVPIVPDKPVGQIGNRSASPELREIMQSGVRAVTYFTPTSADGYQRIVSFRRLSNAPMMFIVGLASEDYLADWMTELHRTAAMAGGFLLLSILLGAMLLRLMALAEAREVSLRDSEAQLRTLVEAEPDVIVLKDAAGRWQVANSAALRVFDIADREWKGLDDARLSEGNPHLRGALVVCSESDGQAWQSRRTTYGEEAVRDRNGNVIELEVVKVPLFDDAGRPTAMVMVGRDITERKRKDAELEQHRRHLESLVEKRTAALLDTEARASHIIESSADGLYGVDPDGVITFINPSACAVLGYRREDVVGQVAHSLFHHSRADGSPYPRAECPSMLALQRGEVVRVDNEVYWRADGSSVPVMYSMHPMMRDGRIVGAVVSFVDVSVQRAAAVAREEALVAAEHLARVRREFLANMSHEIRTPLNGVLGFAAIGERNHADPEKARDAFRKIVVSGQRLMGVINDVLDFSKIEAGKLTIEHASIDLQDVVAHAFEIVRERAEAKGLALRRQIEPSLPGHCKGDPLRLGQVLLNLLSNAVKFTETGSVTLHAARQGDWLTFSVVDTGIGMDAVQQAELFNPFHQVDASATRRFGGTGLGLAISQRILDLMGGEISVSSEPGKGTAVTFRIPYVPDEGRADAGIGMATARPESLSPPLAGVSILVVEDDEFNQQVLVENLQDDGARVTIAGNGREAVECFLSGGRGAFDIVLMDLQMPEMDGYEATRRILELDPDIPVIAQSAHAFIEERDRCLAAGMVDHLAKPIDPDHLLAVILTHLHEG